MWLLHVVCPFTPALVVASASAAAALPIVALPVVVAFDALSSAIIELALKCVAFFTREAICRVVRSGFARRAVPTSLARGLAVGTLQSLTRHHEFV